MMKMFGANLLTLAQMKKEFFAIRKTLEGLGRFFVIEVGFLNDVAEPLLVSKVPNSVFEALPSEIDDKSFGQVLAK